MTYQLKYDFTGEVIGILRLSDNAFIPICETNIDFQAFLKWNLEQAIPLDLNSTIPVVPPQPPHSMHVAALTAVDIVNKKGTVARKWMGTNYTIPNCYVSLQALEAYQAGKVKLFNNAYGITAPENADSFVLVYFISENPYDNAMEIPVIIDKIVK